MMYMYESTFYLHLECKHCHKTQYISNLIAFSVLQIKINYSTIQGGGGVLRYVNYGM